MDNYRTGDHVSWNHAGHSTSGTIQKRYERKVTRKIKGTEITRNGSQDCPAYYIEQKDGDHVLKLHSELKKSH